MTASQFTGHNLWVILIVFSPFMCIIPKASGIGRHDEDGIQIKSMKGIANFFRTGKHDP